MAIHSPGKGPLDPNLRKDSSQALPQPHGNKEGHDIVHIKMTDKGLMVGDQRIGKTVTTLGNIWTIAKAGFSKLTGVKVDSTHYFRHGDKTFAVSEKKFTKLFAKALGLPENNKVLKTLHKKMTPLILKQVAVANETAVETAKGAESGERSIMELSAAKVHTAWKESGPQNIVHNTAEAYIDLWKESCTKVGEALKANPSLTVTHSIEGAGEYPKEHTETATHHLDTIDMALKMREKQVDELTGKLGSEVKLKIAQQQLKCLEEQKEFLTVVGPNYFRELDNLKRIGLQLRGKGYEGELPDLMKHGVGDAAIVPNNPYTSRYKGEGAGKPFDIVRAGVITDPRHGSTNIREIAIQSALLAVEKPSLKGSAEWSPDRQKAFSDILPGAPQPTEKEIALCKELNAKALAASGQGGKKSLKLKLSEKILERKDALETTGLILLTKHIHAAAERGSIKDGEPFLWTQISLLSPEKKKKAKEGGDFAHIEANQQADQNTLLQMFHGKEIKIDAECKAPYIDDKGVVHVPKPEGDLKDTPTTFKLATASLHFPVQGATSSQIEAIIKQNDAEFDRILGSIEGNAIPASIGRDAIKALKTESQNLGKMSDEERYEFGALVATVAGILGSLGVNCFSAKDRTAELQKAIFKSLAAREITKFVTDNAPKEITEKERAAWIDKQMVIVQKNLDKSYNRLTAGENITLAILVRGTGIRASKARTQNTVGLSWGQQIFNAAKALAASD